MFRNLLAPLDGSVLAETVLPVCAYLAGRLSAAVTLVHVIEKDAPQEVHGERHLTSPEEAAAYLKNISLERFPPGFPVTFHVHTAAVEDVPRSITEHGEEFGNDLIVLSTHGSGGMRDVLIGSIAAQVLERSRIPVLIFRPAAGEPAPAFGCRRFLVPLDGDPEHEPGLDLASGLALACGASLHLVAAVPTFGTLSGQWVNTSRLLPGTTSKMLDMAVENAETYLASRRETLRKEGLSATIDVLRGDPVDVISDAAESLSVDLIVLSTHRKAGMEAFWAGSVAPKVCKRCRTPILTMPIQEKP
jgi:nucleotide-binding universal stress UspA family protein